jgi:hypothetical protein
MAIPFSQRVISPQRRALFQLRTLLTAGELAVVEFFDRTLQEGWEIYVQPHMNGLRPDIVLLHPSRGLAVYEIKDWNLSGLRYEYRDISDGAPQLWSQDHSGKWFRRRDNPLSKVIRYKEEIRALYCPRLGALLETNPGAASAITAGVILTQASTVQARQLFEPAIRACGLTGTKARYYTVSGGDALTDKGLAHVFPWAAEDRPSHWMTDDIAADLRSWLVEPDHAAEQRAPLQMNSRQRELATTRTATGYRRIRGPAGSGKSLALAARAAQLSAEGKEVLVMSFNITLLHYLRDLAVRYPDPRLSIVDRITWLHFHGWCKRVCEEAGLEQEYKALWRRHFEAQDDQDQKTAALNHLLESDLPRLVTRAIQETPDSVTQYDAVLCDEGQDLNLDWWNLVRRVVRGDGEMLLAADRTQDLYGKAVRWTEDSLQNAGFRGGRWYELEGSYRFPVELVPHLQRFLEIFLPDRENALPIAVQSDLFEPLHLAWVQVKPDNLVARSIDEIRMLPARVSGEILKWSDVAIVAQTHRIDSEAVSGLEALGIRSCHVFGPDHASSRWRKSAFWMGDARVKAATLHSFKGWESPHLVVLINTARGPEECRGIYVALSRLRRHAGGSTLLVVSAAPELAVYGSTWPSFLSQ